MGHMRQSSTADDTGYRRTDAAPGGMVEHHSRQGCVLSSRRCPRARVVALQSAAAERFYPPQRCCTMDRIDARDSILVVIDMQERLFPRVHRWERVRERLLFTIRGSKIFNIPIIITEQNPNGLGATVPEVEAALPIYSPEVKMSFCAFDCPTFEERVIGSGRRTLIVIGIETHICILQTVMEALSRGFRVYVVADATSSTDLEDHEVALDRMARLGAVITTSQSLLYELMGSADDERFRDLLDLVKSSRRKMPALYAFESSGEG